MYSAIFDGRSESSSLNDVVQPPHIRAVRSSTAETRPPFHSRGRGSCSGFGDRNASLIVVNLPSYETSSSVHSRVRIVRHSSNRATRSACVTPYNANSSGRQPTARQYVDVRQRLGEYDGVVERSHDARCGEADPVRLGGKIGQRGEDLVVAGPVKVPLTEHDPLEAGLLGQPRLLDGILQPRPLVRRAVEVQIETQPHQ